MWDLKRKWRQFFCKHTPIYRNAKSMSGWGVACKICGKRRSL